MSFISINGVIVNMDLVTGFKAYSDGDVNFEITFHHENGNSTTARLNSQEHLNQSMQLLCEHCDVTDLC